MWTQRWPQTSKRAASQLVLVWVGRWTWPNWISAEECAARTSTGKPALRIFSASCQSISVSKSTRGLSARSVMVWVMVEPLPKARVTRIEPTRTSRSTTVMDSTSRSSV